ncbi:MAG: membrane protein insertase YidC [Nitrososphaerota archaeon]|nr:membrane protein insertase YidC [Nitrososphaerota archaeon]
MVEPKPVRTPKLGRLFIFLLIVLIISLLIAGVISITGIWNTILLRPMLNFLVLTSKYFLGSFGIAIIILTIIIRLITIPYTMRQLRSSKGMREIQPKLKELQKKYDNDRQKLGQETIKLYKEAGINPSGCVFPILAQFPIWVALYQSVAQALAATPEYLFGLGKQLYSPMIFQEAVPLNHYFLWLDLARSSIVMAFLEAGSLWILTKMASLPATGSQQQFMDRVMPWAMPLLFGFLALILPSGLTLYWVTSNIIGIILQYRVTGWGTLKMPSLSFLNRATPKRAANPSSKPGGVASTVKKVRKGVVQQENSRGKRKD